jgi:hypothetical protein
VSRFRNDLIYRAALFAVLLLLATGCAGRQQYVAQSQTVDGLTITLEQPRELIALQDYELFVTLADAEGAPVDGASVYLDLTMTGMTMGVNQPLADPLGGGRYRVRTVHSMEGDWLVTVHARVAGRDYAAVFEYPVALPS